MATLSKTYSVLLSGTSGEYLDVTIERTMDTVSWWVDFRISNNGYYHYNKGNQLKVWFNDDYVLKESNVCAIYIDGPGSQRIASGSFSYSGTDLYIWVEFDQTQMSNQYGLIEEHFYMYKVTYHGNGGTYNGSTTWLDTTRSPVMVGSWYTVYNNSNFFVRNGYTFTGWRDQNGVDWTESIDNPWQWTSNYAYDITLYAQWSANSYTVSYNANGGTGAPQTQTVRHDQSIYLSTQVPKRDGYNFLGWSLSSNATAATYAPGSKWNTYSNQILYAVWIKVHQITFDGNGGLVNGNSLLMQKVTNGTKITTMPEAAMKYYKFLGWNTSKDGSGSYCDEFVAIADITFYAIYEVESNCYVKVNEIYQRGIAYIKKDNNYHKAIRIS